MPLKLVPPRKGKSKSWSVRGTYLGVYVDRSAKTTEKKIAAKALAKWKREIERGEFSAPSEPTFLSAAVSYMQADGENRFLKPIIAELGARTLRSIDQATIDAAAVKLYPDAPASTRNRQFYTPVSAVLKHAGIKAEINRPKGWRGNKRTFWIEPEPTFALLNRCAEVDAEFWILCTLLNYTGLRLSEALYGIECERLFLDRAYAYVPDTKTGEPRPVFLPPVAVAALANHPRGLERRGRVFRFTANGKLTKMLRTAALSVGIDLPARTAFHVFRHNYATWMRDYVGLDGIGLTRTGAWKDLASVERYTHSKEGVEARRASALPVEKTWKRA
jgi:integrase